MKTRDQAKMANPDSIISPSPYMELLSSEEFTNRKRELRFLWRLADEATRRQASSYAFIALG